jgi:hypothetical protein
MAGYDAIPRAPGRFLNMNRVSALSVRSVVHFDGGLFSKSPPATDLSYSAKGLSISVFIYGI